MTGQAGMEIQEAEHNLLLKRDWEVGVLSLSCGACGWSGLLLSNMTGMARKWLEVEQRGELGQARTYWSSLHPSMTVSDCKEDFLRITTATSLCLANLMQVSPLANSNQLPRWNEILVPHVEKVTILQVSTTMINTEIVLLPGCLRAYSTCHEVTRGRGEEVSRSDRIELCRIERKRLLEWLLGLYFWKREEQEIENIIIHLKSILSQTLRSHELEDFIPTLSLTELRVGR